MQEINKVYSLESVDEYMCTNYCLKDRRTELPSTEEIADLVPALTERLLFDWPGTTRADLFMTLDILVPSVLFTLIEGPLKEHAVLCDVSKDLDPRTSK